MTGKKWFYWLGALHGRRKQVRVLSTKLPWWARDAYDAGWRAGFSEMSGRSE